jgi:predicted ArsR family transcriptional regulator
MLLNRIRSYLQLNRRAAIHDMVSVLDISPDALRAMLKMLETRGAVRRLPSGTPCGGSCTKCTPDTIELYEWVRQ